MPDLHARERKAYADLVGLSTVPSDPLVIDLVALDAELRAGRLGMGLSAAIEELGGPIIDRHAARNDERERKARMWSSAEARVEAMERPELHEWLGDIRGNGVLTRAARADEIEPAALLDQALEVLARLPAEDVILAALAAETTGDAHALDNDRPLTNLILRAGARMVGWPAVPKSINARRRLWSEVGVLCDLLSSHALVHCLRPSGAGRLTRYLQEASDAGEPARLTLRELRNEPLIYASGSDVFVVENPSIVAAAADRLNAGCGALVCVEGVPSGATLEVLQGLQASGVRLHFHADFDWGGIRIGNELFSRFGGTPWRFEAADYKAAVSVASAWKALAGRPVSAGWDEQLRPSLAEHRRVVFEEHELDNLLADLRAAN